MAALIRLTLFESKDCKSSDTWEGHASSGSGVQTWIFNFLVVKSKAFITRRYILKPVKSKCHRRKKHLFSAMGAFHINCAVISFAQDL